MYIKLEQLTKRFGDAVVLDQLSYERDIETLAIIGPSGSGKSTLLRIMAGLISPSSGSLYINQEKLPSSPSELVSWHKKMAFVFQQKGLFQHMTALENIVLPLVEVHKLSRDAATKRALDLLERFGLADATQKYPLELSGGQQQRVAIARAVSVKPELLLLDEPTSALDPEYTAEVLNLLNELKNEGAKFIIVTHEMGFARHACKDLIFLAENKIIEEGPSAALFSNPKSPELQNFLAKLLAWEV